MFLKSLLPVSFGFTNIDRDASIALVFGDDTRDKRFWNYVLEAEITTKAVC